MGGRESNRKKALVVEAPIIVISGVAVKVLTLASNSRSTSLAPLMVQVSHLMGKSLACENPSETPDDVMRAVNLGFRNWLVKWRAS